MYRKIVRKALLVISIIGHKSFVFYYNMIYRTYSKLLFRIRLLNNQPKADYLHFYSNETRSVEILPEDFCLTEVIFTCYFVHKENPQTHEVFYKADFRYIQRWYESVIRLKINAIIIHDGIDEGFIETYQNEKIKFRRFYHGKFPLIDERWIAYYQFMKAIPIKKVFFTDIGDVVISSNPFILINDNKNTLFIGRDNANKIRLSGWILNEINNYSSDTGIRIPKSLYYQSLYNVGVVGGNRKVMLFLLSRVVDYLLLKKSDYYKEMTIFNLIIHKNFFPKLNYKPNEQVITNPYNDGVSSHKFLVTGYPLNSEFKKFDLESDAYFIHK